MSKTLLSGALLVLVVLGIVVSPYGMRGAADVINAHNEAEATKEMYASNLRLVEEQLVTTVGEFNDQRSFGVFYNDVPKLIGVLKGINGITVKTVTNVDPMSNYAEVGLWQEGDEPNAVMVDLVVKEPLTVLKVLDTMELPIVSLDIQMPDTVNIIFLTGGVV